MKTNLKVLMLGLLVTASFSANAYWGESWVRFAKDNTWGHAKSFCGYYFNKESWSNSPYYLTAGTAVTAAAVGCAAFLAYKKIQAKRQKASETIAE